MSFWAKSLVPGGKEETVGEEFTDVTITRASISNAEKVKEGTRASLLCMDGDSGKWIMVCRFAIGREESVPLRLYVAAQNELKFKVSSGEIKIDLSGYQALPPFLDGMHHGHDHDEEGNCLTAEEKEEMEVEGEDSDEDEDEEEDGEEEEGEEEEEDDEDDEDEEEEEEEEEVKVGQKRKADPPAAKEAAAKATKKAGGDSAAEAARKAAPAAAAGGKLEGDFVASTKFQGQKAGYVFKKDKLGLGYYKDVKKAPAAAKKQSAADAWAEKKLAVPQWRSGPGGLKIRDDKLGAGNETPRRGKMVTVHYTGKLKSGKQFDSSVGRKPLTFRFGAGQVIKGWDMGLDGMKPGGRRTLEIPPALGYGRGGAPPDIPGNATLVFDVQLLKC